MKIPKGYENLVKYWGSCHNAFALPIVLTDGMCKPFGLLRNYNCDKTMLFLLHCVVANVFFGFSFGNYFTKNAVAVIHEEERKEQVAKELEELDKIKASDDKNFDEKKARKASNQSYASILSNIDIERQLSKASQVSSKKDETIETEQIVTERKSILQKFVGVFWFIVDVFDNQNAKGILVGAF